jgi:hypothetical protein
MKRTLLLKPTFYVLGITLLFYWNISVGITIISGSVMTSTEITKALQTATYHTPLYEVRGEFWKSLLLTNN